MKSLLINPPYLKYVYENRKDAASIDAPLSLAYIAAVLEKNGLKVEILDANAHNMSLGKTAQYVKESDAQLVGITATTTVIPVVYKLAKAIKAVCGKAIVVGGPHVSFEAERTLRECPQIDMIVRGEGEITFLSLAKAGGRPENIPGISYRKGRRIIHNNPRDPIENIDSLPFPARHLLPMHLYNSGSMISKGNDGLRYASVITTRGCPNKCVYCSSSHFWGTRVRFRSPENVVEEVEHLQRSYGTREIFFKDDTFTFSPVRTEQICDLIISKGIDIKWSCYARVNTISEKLLRKMVKAGCFALDFGIESGNQDVLDRIHKNITLEQAEAAVKLSKSMGVMVYASFMFGLPSENMKRAKETIDFAVKISPDIAQFFITTPFPGTELYTEAVEKGWIKEIESWGKLNIITNREYRNDDLTNDQIHMLMSMAYKKFYFRPPFILQAMKRLVRDPVGLAPKYLKGGLAVLNLL